MDIIENDWIKEIDNEHREALRQMYVEPMNGIPKFAEARSKDETRKAALVFRHIAMCATFYGSYLDTLGSVYPENREAAHHAAVRKANADYRKVRKMFGYFITPGIHF